MPLPPPFARHTSRAVFTASRQLSVPPVVTDPTTSPASDGAVPCNSSLANATTSRSITATDVKVVGSSPFTGCTARIAAAASSSSSARPES
jgi:hypothetical protein